ncbi:MAG TPA: hypothetical protein VEZ90_07395, partial [Blastocatellia bacterium]|nr:hypothetical protein [Blastocatellia bacterium]
MKKRATWLVATVVFFSTIGFALQDRPEASASLDPSFGSGGTVQTSFGVSVMPETAILQPDGKIVVVAGFDNTDIATEAFGLVRYLPDGQLDSNFGNRGSAVAAVTNFLNLPHSVALQPDGRILVAGETVSSSGSTDEFFVARFDANGVLDPSFGSGGLATASFGGVRNAAFSMILQRDGRILVSGIMVPGGRRNPSRTAMVRFDGN